MDSKGSRTVTWVAIYYSSAKRNSVWWVIAESSVWRRAGGATIPLSVQDVTYQRNHIARRMCPHLHLIEVNGKQKPDRSVKKPFIPSARSLPIQEV
jgi:hypothetical protein